MKKTLFLFLALLAFTAGVRATDVTIAANQIAGFNPSAIGSDVTLTNVSVTNGSTAVSCASCLRTPWIGLGGFRISINGTAHTVASVDSASALTLTSNYAGATSSTASVIVYKYIELRIYANQAFQPLGAAYVVQPGTPGSGAWYRRYAAAVVVAGGASTLYLPQIVLDATTDAPVNNTTKYTAGFYRTDGSLISYYQCFREFGLPPATPTSWPDICTYNQSLVIVPDNTAYTKAQIDARFRPCQSNQLYYFATTGNAPNCLTLGTGLSITSGVLNASGGGGGGTTINPSNSVLPYRLNGTTFADSPLTIATPTQINIAADTIPATDNARDLGSSALRWRSLHLGPASLVIHNDATNTAKVTLGFSGSSARLFTDAGTQLQTAIGTTVGTTLDTAGNFAIGTGALATSATNGFLYLPSAAGSPTGAPTAFAGRVPLLVDTLNNRLWGYNGGWRNLSRNADVINVVDEYGAVCDGATSAQTPIQNAIAAAQTGTRKDVYIPGDCLVSGLTISGQVNIVGDGEGQSVLRSTTNAPIVDLTGDASFLGGSIQGVRIVGSVSAGANQTGLRLDHATGALRFLVRDVRIETTGGPGLYVGNVFSSYFENIRISDTAGYPLLYNAPNQPTNIFTSIYIGRLRATAPTAFRIKAGDFTGFSLNGIDNVLAGSNWMVIGRKNGVDEDLVNAPATAVVHDSNAESWTSRAFLLYSSSSIELHGATTIAGDGGTAAATKIGIQFENNGDGSTFFAQNVKRSKIDDGVNFADGVAAYNSSQPIQCAGFCPIDITGVGPQTGGGAPLNTYRDTSGTAANRKLARSDGRYARNIITSSTTITQPGPNYYEVSSAGGPVTLTLEWPGWHANSGTMVIVKDTGGAAANNITIQASGGGTVNGSSYVLSKNGEAVVLLPDGNTGAGDWRVVGRFLSVIGDVSIAGTAVQDYFPRWDATGRLTAQSAIYQLSNTLVTIEGILNNSNNLYDIGALSSNRFRTLYLGTSLDVGINSSVTGSVVFRNATNANPTTLRAGAPASALTITLPATLPASAGCLQIDNAGAISQTGSACGSGGSGLGDPGANGIVVRTGVNVTTARSLAAGSSKVTVTNADGTAGNPTIDVAEANLTLGNLVGSIDLGGTKASGTLAAGRFPALTGDVTTTAGSLATTITNDAVTLAKLQNIATASFLGRVTAATGDPEVLTGTQATTLLDVFTSSLKGLVPASGGGTTNFLRADGTWAAPAGGGGMSIGGAVSSGTAGSVLFVGAGPVLSQNNASFFWDNTNVRLGLGTSAPQALLDVGGLSTATPTGITGAIPARFSASSNAIAGVVFQNVNTGTSAEFRFVVMDDANDAILTYSVPSAANATASFGIPRNQLVQIQHNAVTTGRDIMVGNIRNNGIVFATSNTTRGAFQAGGSFALVSGGQIGWSNSSSDPRSGFDTGLARHAAGQVRLTNGSTGAGQLLVATSTATIGAQAHVISSAASTTGLRVDSASGPTSPTLMATNNGTEVFGVTANQTYGAAEFDKGNVTGTVNINLNDGNHQKMRLTGNITTLNITNPRPGAFYILTFIQDGVGSRTTVTPTIIKNAGGAITLTGTSNARDELWCRSDGTNLYCGLFFDVK